MWTEITQELAQPLQCAPSNVHISFGVRKPKKENIELHNMKREKSRKKDNFAYLFAKKRRRKPLLFCKKFFFRFVYFSKSIIEGNNMRLVFSLIQGNSYQLTTRPSPPS